MDTITASETREVESTFNPETGESRTVETVTSETEIPSPVAEAIVIEPSVETSELQDAIDNILERFTDLEVRFTALEERLNNTAQDQGAGAPAPSVAPAGGSSPAVPGPISTQPEPAAPASTEVSPPAPETPKEGPGADKEEPSSKPGRKFPGWLF